MKLDIVIPTRKRLEKLVVCLKSLTHRGVPEGVDIWVYFDTVAEVIQFGMLWPGLRGLVHVESFPDYTAPKLWNYHLKRMQADGMMYLNDDVEMLGDGVVVAKNQFVLTFPYYDGVMGFVQANLKGRFDTAPAAFGIVGSKFADGFPERQVFCPEYHHLWIDRELEMAARAKGKFVVAEQVKLNHYHPCLGAQFDDDTHHYIRQWKEQDKKVWEARRAKGWVWGVDFNKVGGECG